MNFQRKIQFNGYQIKMVAFMSMLIDHFAVIFLSSSVLFDNKVLNFNYLLYCVCRSIGRISFPLFAFLLVEGIKYTKNKIVYMQRILLFTIISEIPYDWGITGKAIDFKHQNVFFSLVLGLTLILIFQLIEKKCHSIGNMIIKILNLFLFMFLAEFIRTDYGCVGIIVILLFYLINKKNIAIIISCLILTFLLKNEMFCWIAVIPIFLYNNTRGQYNKYFFYIAYPIHFVVFRAIYIILK